MTTTSTITDRIDKLYMLSLFCDRKDTYFINRTKPFLCKIYPKLIALYCWGVLSEEYEYKEDD